MGRATGATVPSGVDGPRAAASRWMDEQRDVLVGLRALRALGSDATPAVDAVMELPSVRRLLLSWELAVSLAESEGRDGRDALVDLLGVDDVELIEAAAFGLAPRRLVCLAGGKS